MAPRITPTSIARHLVQLIEDGELTPGEPLRELALARRFGCSRVPVREALRIVASQGLVIVEPMRGARVAELRDLPFLETFLIRRALAGVIVRLAAENGSSAQRRVFLERALALPEVANVDRTGQQFHEALHGVTRLIPAMAKAGRTEQMSRTLTLGRETFQSTSLATRARRRQVASSWLAVGRAVWLGDGLAAARSIEAIYDQAFRFVAMEWNALPQDPQPFG